MAATPIGDQIVGREAEAARLVGWIAQCQAGQGRAALIEGEPGIGKSALVRAAGERGAKAGLVVLRGAGDELGQALPLLPFLSALAVREPASDERRDRAVRLLRGEFALGCQVDAVAAASEQLFAVVEQTAMDRPTVLIIDDLHWADTASVALWARLARAAAQWPLLLLGAVRPVPQRNDLRALRRAVHDDLLKLGPLAEPAVDALITVLTGAPPGPRLQRLAADAGGNPLYLTELVGALARGDRLARGAADTVELTGDAAPDTLSDAIADRLGFLPEPVHAVLRAAALLGVHFAVDDLAVVQRRTVNELLPPLDEAIASGVLAGSPDGLSFRHPLIRTALYEELPPALRAAWHREAAQALAAAAAPVDRVARQLLSGIGPAGTHATSIDVWLQDWLVEAGPALTAQAPKVAVDLLRRAVDEAAGRGEKVYGTLAGQLAIALLQSGDYAGSATVASTALERISDPDLTFELHWALADSRAVVGRFAESLVDLERALAVPGTSAANRARLMVMIARTHRAMGEVDVMFKFAQHALAEALTADDSWAIGWGSHLMTVVSMMRGDGLGALAQFDRALAVTAGEPRLADLRLLLQANQAVVLGDLDRLPEAIVKAREVRASAAQVGSVLREAQALSTLGDLLGDHGEWDEALDAVEAFPDGTKDLGVSCCDHGVAITILLHRGEVDAAREHLDAVAAPAAMVGDRMVATLVVARALWAEHEGRPGDALAILTRGLGGPAEELDEVADLIPDAIRLAFECDDRETLLDVTRRAEELLVKGNVPRRFGTVLYGRGVLQRDQHLLGRAADQFEAAGRPLPRASALAAAAVIAAGASDRETARATFSQALDLFGQLGADWDAARLQTRMRAYGIRRAPRVSHRQARRGWLSLTPTEAKVADLVVRGLSNPQIAAELYLSPRTVATHVSHILAKLDLHSRIDLAREAGRRESSGD